MSSPHIDQVVQWIECILRDGINLTVWEEQFIEGMQTKVEAYGDRAVFTPGQQEQIERIYSERVP